MAEELQKYKDILKREREEFKRQLVREVSTSKLLFILIKNEQYFEFIQDWNFIMVFSQNYDLISLSNCTTKFSFSIILVFQKILL